MKSIKLFLERYLFNLYFYLHIFTQQRKIKKKTKILIDTFKKGDLDFFKETKKSDTLCILGSGKSVNNYSSEDWDEIAKCDTVGVNFWLINDFIPDLYSIELSGSIETPQIRYMLELLEIKKQDYSKVKFYLKDLWRATDVMKMIPEELKKNVVLGNDIEIPGERVKGFKRSLKRLFLNRKQTDEILLYKKRASISMWIYYAYLMEYKNVVLCGVDLNGSCNFYEEKPEYYINKGIPIKSFTPKNSIHKTIDKNYGLVTIDVVINEFYEKLLEPNKINLYVGSKESILYPKYNCYFEVK